MRTQPSRAVARTLVAVKAAALSALLSLTLLIGIDAGQSASDQPQAVAEAYSRVVERAMTDQRCSTQGFGTDQIPGSALIRTPEGAVEVVSFARGWDIFNGRRPGTLIAVCLEEQPSTGTLAVSSR